MSSSNNFNFLRLIAAFMVLYSHSFDLLGHPLVPMFLSWCSLGALGVYIFFIISGYLICESWDRDPNLMRFFSRRALRIFPGLIVCLIFTTFILGPCLTTLSLHDYFSNEYTFLSSVFKQNISVHEHYYLPGVFTDNPYPFAVNGSLWTLRIEMLMYIIVAMIGAIYNNRWAFLALAISFGSGIFLYVQHNKAPIFFNIDCTQVFNCGIYFWMGAVFYKFNLKRYLSLSVVLLAVGVLFCLEAWPSILTFAAWILLPITILAFGFTYSPWCNRLIATGDYSYGIYIYAFPVQQTIAHFYPKMAIGLYLLICTSLALLCAILSWHLLEKKALSLKPSKDGMRLNIRNTFIKTYKGLRFSSLFR